MMWLLATVSQTIAAEKPGLVLYLPFEEGKGDVAGDASGNGNDGKLINKPKWVTGQIGMALEFDGSNYVEAADQPNSGFDGVDGLTIEAWVKQGAHHDNGIVVKLTGAGFWPNSYNLETWSDANMWFGVFQDALAISAPNYPLNEWFHFTGVFDGKAKKQYIYLNGNEVAQGPAPTDTVPDGDQPVWIGIVDPNNFFFRGMLDEIAIYSRALTPAEIQQDMNGVILAVQSKDKLATTWGKVKRGR
jgi:hypothetical protein